MRQLFDGLSTVDRRKLLETFGDAGRKSTFLYISKDFLPSIPSILNNAQKLLHLRHESPFWENIPYYDDLWQDQHKSVLKVHFHYLHGVLNTLDEHGKQREQRLQYYGCVVYRPGKKILEIRVHHKSMADKIASTWPILLSVPIVQSINLLDEGLIKSFVDWIQSLNSANILLDSTDSTAGSLRITARRGMDLRTAERYARELKNGELIGGHVTIEHEAEKINFRITYQDCLVSYTLFTEEKGISYEIEAFEKIVEGFEFERPTKILTDFFR